MRCPRCQDEFEDYVVVCPDCGINLSDADAPPPIAVRVDARLGRFHPAVAAQLLKVLEHRGIAHDTVTAPDAIAIVVDRSHRDDLRAELTLSWNDVVRQLDQETSALVQAEGGSTPGWYDPPRGGHVDRAGRLVVGDEQDDSDHDAARVIGPGLIAAGVVLLLVGWYVLDSAAIAVAGAALALLGPLLPR